MISVTEALDQILGLLTPLEVEIIPLRDAAGRILAEDVTAKRDQPPFAASSMDGYAVFEAEVHPGAQFSVLGESAAGGAYSGALRAGQAVRIFTGAPLPMGADRVIIQEDIQRQGDSITLNQTFDKSTYIRPKGADFKIGDTIAAPRKLSASDVALLASMNIANVPVRRKPIVALLANGDELVMPGETPGPDQIIASNNFGLAALLEAQGALTRILPIAKDQEQSLKTVFGLCEGADLIVTIGGASVGDHDIVHKVASDLGLETHFYKVAMRPGKPLMAGNLAGTPMVGLPGNPVSSMVCGHIFLRPAIDKMLGLKAEPLSCELARLAGDLPENGSREHYMRAELTIEYAQLTARPFERQDSALLSVLARANGFLRRPPFDPAKSAGDMVEVIRI